MIEDPETPTEEKESLGLFHNLRMVFEKLKRVEVTRKLCPKCESSEIQLSSKFDVWLFPEQYFCSRCGYKGPIVMELEREQIEEA